MARSDVSFIFDLDGTLVDNVYQHVMAWQEALQAEHIDLSMWRIHRRVGSTSPPRSLSATASGTCSRRGARAALAWACYPAATTRTSWSAQGRSLLYEDPADLLRHIDEIGGRT